MNKFIGTKEILATPMTRGEYNEYRGWTIPDNEDPNEAGYLVEYTDGGKPNDDRHAGYISWSPADVFNRAYAPAETWLDRVKLEKANMQTMLDALEVTLRTESKPDAIAQDQWDLMHRQQFHMRQYVQILEERINKAEVQS